jgi:multidrug resistance efflux pump
MKLQLKRVRYQVLPAVIFALSLAATIYLWKGYAGAPHGLGEVTTVTVRVAAAEDGRLAANAEHPRIYDRVTAGVPIARFDVSTVVTEHEKVQDALTKAEADLAAAEKQIEETKGTDKAKADQLRAQAAPLRSAVADLISRRNDLDRKIRAGTVESPVNGTITAVFCQPNEFVRQGQELFTVTEDNGASILTFVRPGSGVAPKKDQRVVVRSQMSKKSAMATVQEVGGHVQEVPDAQLANAKRKEWGIPVRISMPEPDKLQLRPGEVVTVNYLNEK